MDRRRLFEDREAKERLVKLLEGSVKLDDVVEWLWEDFGIRVSPTWDDVRRTIVSSREVSARALAVFLVQSGAGHGAVENAYLGEG